MAPSLRVVPQIRPCGVARRSFRITKFSPRVLPGLIWGGNAAMFIVLTGPSHDYMIPPQCNWTFLHGTPRMMQLQFNISATNGVLTISEIR